MEPHSLTTPDGGLTWIDPGYSAVLSRAGLTSFDAFMATEAGDCWRRFPDRENWRLELRDDQGRPLAAHLKKHRATSWPAQLRVWLGGKPPPSPARIEADNVARLQAIGVESMRVIAWGERHRGRRLESFLLTEELAGFTELQFFLMRRFAPLAARPARRDPALETLIRQVADLTGRFHRAGYNHRDLYAGHFFVRPSAGGYEIRLIDLQRVQHRRRFRTRWIVKDLAQLAWSLPEGWLTRGQKLAFLREYLAAAGPGGGLRRWAGRVTAKQRRYQRKLGPVRYDRPRFETGLSRPS